MVLICSSRSIRVCVGHMWDYSGDTVRMYGAYERTECTLQYVRTGVYAPVCTHQYVRTVRIRTGVYAYVPNKTKTVRGVGLRVVFSNKIRSRTKDTYASRRVIFQNPIGPSSQNEASGQLERTTVLTTHFSCSNNAPIHPQRRNGPLCTPSSADARPA